jgi:hypothetical protein
MMFSPQRAKTGHGDGQFEDIPSLQKAIAALCKKGDAPIRLLELDAHGHETELNIGRLVDGEAHNISKTNATAFGAWLRKNVKVTRNAAIILNGCLTGCLDPNSKKNTVEDIWPLQLAKSSHVQVWAPQGIAYGQVVKNTIRVRAWDDTNSCRYPATDTRFASADDLWTVYFPDGKIQVYNAATFKYTTIRQPD